MRSSVDLPQPEAPIRQTNSPLLMRRSTWCNASTLSSFMKKVLLTSLIRRKGRRSTMMLRAPAQDPVVERDDDAVADEAGDADDDHHVDDEVGARHREACHDHRAQSWWY